MNENYLDKLDAIGIHKHLQRLIRLRDALKKRYKRLNSKMIELDFPDGGVWAIWLGLLRDIKECGLSYGYKIDGIRLYHYNNLWKTVKDYAPAEEEPLDRAARFAKQPLPEFIYQDSYETAVRKQDEETPIGWIGIKE